MNAKSYLTGLNLTASLTRRKQVNPMYCPCAKNHVVQQVRQTASCEKMNRST